jgi:hypothetical protein
MEYPHLEHLRPEYLRPEYLRPEYLTLVPSFLPLEFYSAFVRMMFVENLPRRLVVVVMVVVEVFLLFGEALDIPLNVG